MSNLRRKKRIAQILLIGISLAALFILIRYQIMFDQEDGMVKDIQIESTDEAIKISWNSSFISNVDHMVIRVTDENDIVCEEISVKPQRKSYYFSDGELNKSYDVTVSAVYKDGQKEQLAQEKRLLLNMDELPDLPILYITTYSGNDPTATFVEAGDRQVGKTIQEKNSEEGVLVYSSDDQSVETKVTIEIRGNTSADSEKEPYKITLDRALDLLDFDGEHNYTEWVLLNSGTKLNNYLGQCASEYCDMEWVTESKYVNVFMNGDWKGLYTLSEPVSRKASHGLVSKNGYIIEDDAYWWNADGIYFKLGNQVSELGYTFKYPSLTSEEDERLEEMHQFMQNFMNLSLNNDAGTWENADLDSFVSWMLVHDMLQWGDAVGANTFYYIYDYSSEDESDYILKMGPVWDCDGAVNGKNYQGEHGLSEQHNSLLKPYVDNLDFIEEYRKRWNELSDGVAPMFMEKLQELYENEGEALDLSRALDTERWGSSFITMEKEMSNFEIWINDQVAWMNSYWGDQ